MIDSVYNVVQEVLNKNGYGLLTPTRFVYFAESAQLEVFEDVLHEMRIIKRNTERVDSTDTLGLYEAVLEIFSENAILSREDNEGNVQPYHIMPDDYMRWGSAMVDDKPITKIDGEQRPALKNYFINPSLSTPFAYIEGHKMYVLPETIGVISDNGTLIPYDEVELHYYRYPKKPNWTYETVMGKPVFNPDSELYQDFELPQSMFNPLVIKILSLAGVHMRSESIFQYAENADQKNYQKSTN